MPRFNYGQLVNTKTRKQSVIHKFALSERDKVQTLITNLTFKLTSEIIKSNRSRSRNPNGVITFSRTQKRRRALHFRLNSSEIPDVQVYKFQYNPRSHMQRGTKTMRGPERIKDSVSGIIHVRCRFSNCERAAEKKN